MVCCVCIMYCESLSAPASSLLRVKLAPALYMHLDNALVEGGAELRRGLCMIRRATTDLAKHIHPAGIRGGTRTGRPRRRGPCGRVAWCFVRMPAPASCMCGRGVWWPGGRRLLVIRMGSRGRVSFAYALDVARRHGRLRTKSGGTYILLGAASSSSSSQR